MLQLIKNLIISNNFVFYLATNLYGLLSGRVCTGVDNQKVILKNKNQKFILPAKSKIYAFDVIKDWEEYTSHIKPDGIENNCEIFDFSELKQHYLKNDLVYNCSYLPEDMRSVNVYTDYLKPQEGDVIFDLGANCGLSALYLSQKANNNAKILAVEPDKLNYEILCKNIKQWNLNNIIPLNCAVWTQKQELVFSQDSSLGSCVDKFRSVKTEVVKVQAYSLYDICSEYNLEKVTAIKMDIEGSEYALFENIDDFINKFRPKFIIEIHNNEKSAPDTNYFINKFNNFNYGCKIIPETKNNKFPLLFAQPELTE